MPRWPENPDDADARALKADLGKKKAQLKAALGMARMQLGLAGAAGMERLEEDLDSSESVLGFLGPEGGAAASLGLAADAGAPECLAALRRVAQDTHQDHEKAR